MNGYGLVVAVLAIMAVFGLVVWSPWVHPRHAGPRREPLPVILPAVGSMDLEIDQLWRQVGTLNLLSLTEMARQAQAEQDWREQTMAELAPDALDHSGHIHQCGCNICLARCEAESVYAIPEPESSEHNRDVLPHGDRGLPASGTERGHLPAPQVWADRNAGRFDSAPGRPGNGHAPSGAPGLPALVPRLGDPIRVLLPPRSEEQAFRDLVAWEEARLLRTTGEVVSADLLADVSTFMARQDAEVAAWLAQSQREWATA